MKKRTDRRKGSDNIKPEDILAEHTPEVRALAESLRQLIRETVPNAIELAYPVWHGIGYRHAECGYFCGIFPQKRGVKLGFEFGVLLPDPNGLLEGDGKQVKYVNIKISKDIQVGAIKKLLVLAISLPASREVKMDLVRASAKPVQEKR
jgi:hypothetical protein